MTSPVAVRHPAIPQPPIAGRRAVRRKVLHVLEATSAGAARYVADLLLRIDTDEFDVSFAYSPIRADRRFWSDLAAIQARGIQTFEIPMSRSIQPRADGRALWSLFQLIRSQGFDLVHGHSSKAGFLARVAGKIAGTLARHKVVTVYSPHAIAISLNPAYAHLERLAGWFTDAVLGVSRSERDELIAYRLMPSTKLHFVTAGIDVAGYSSSHDGRAFRRWIGVPAGAILIGSAGRISRQKDPFTFLRAAAQLRKMDVPAYFAWAGDGELRQEAESLSMHLGLRDRVRFAGQCSDLRPFLAALDIFALTSRYESFGYVTCEAMAMGKPIVATNVSGSRELVADGLTGFLVEPGDAAGAAAALQRLAQDTLLRRSMGRAARKRAREQFERRTDGAASGKSLSGINGGMKTMESISQIMEKPAAPTAAAPPICVDLDGTLVRTDLLLESLLSAVRKNPLVLFYLPFWLARGKAALKQKLAAAAGLDPALLPYHEPLLDYLRAQKQSGSKLYLTTASNQRLAQKVADHLGLFDGVLASDEWSNLKGARKRRAIEEELLGQPYLYAGDSAADLPIWSGSAGAITVGASRAVTAALKRGHIPIVAGFTGRSSRGLASLKALRIYQWCKNVLVFVPLLLGHAVNFAHVLPATVAFFAFSLCASAFYVINDLLDLEADRVHPRKRRRPFASGALSIPDGFRLLACLVPAIVLLNLWLPPQARWLLAFYALVNLLYSVQLKRVMFLDVLVLACMYTLRLLYGAAASAITVSLWTLAFSLFLFLGLALVKRLTELRLVRNHRGTSVARRAYLPIDIGMIRSFASASLYLSVLVLALYINSTDVGKLYHRPEALWFVGLLLIYWISRVLMLANRGALTDDPIVFAFRDRPSRCVAVLVAGCVALAL